MLLGVDR